MMMESERVRDVEQPPRVEIASGYDALVPGDFRDDPFGYFEAVGVNVKDGETQIDEGGRIQEDPTAVKYLPAWQTTEGMQRHVMGKRVNIEKGEVSLSGDPFYEYDIMRKIRAVGLPASRPIAKAEHDGEHLIIMERIPGLRWSKTEKAMLKQNGFTESDIEHITDEARQRMESMQQRFEAAGIKRTWKLGDMIFDVDMINKTLRSITPTDWERTTINEDAYEAYRAELRRRAVSGNRV